MITFKNMTNWITNLLSKFNLKNNNGLEKIIFDKHNEKPDLFKSLSNNKMYKSIYAFSYKVNDFIENAIFSNKNGFMFNFLLGGSITVFLFALLFMANEIMALSSTSFMIIGYIICLGILAAFILHTYWVANNHMENSQAFKLKCDTMFKIDSNTQTLFNELQYNEYPLPSEQQIKTLYLKLFYYFKYSGKIYHKDPMFYFMQNKVNHLFNKNKSMINGQTLRNRILNEQENTVKPFENVMDFLELLQNEIVIMDKLNNYNIQYDINKNHHVFKVIFALLMLNDNNESVLLELIKLDNPFIEQIHLNIALEILNDNQAIIDKETQKELEKIAEDYVRDSIIKTEILNFYKPTQTENNSEAEAKINNLN